jgi:WD40 repeat protein/actin-like ATPase involved in cell morphogenesis
MSDPPPSIGIDFGTTNSSMAWCDPRTGEVETILNAEGQPKTPSLVYFDEKETLVGEPVENLIQDVATDRVRRDKVFRRTIASIKRNLLSPPRIALPGGRYIRPVDVVSEILKKLKRDAEDGLFHQEVGRAVITCPAEFNVLQRQKIEEAGRLAGFREVVLVEEPVAGALAYTRAGLDVGNHVLVYDLGGGTFDLAVLDNEDESFHVAMEPKGVERCGGDDFDLALYHHCDEVARENLGRPISLTGAVDLSFLRACRRRKESLTFQQRGRFNDYLSSENGPVRFEHEVDRQTFEELISEYVETTTRLTEEILKQADIREHEVDTVVLVGGSTRVPLVTRTLKETLPVSPLGFDRKDVAVALGAAHYTNIRWRSARRGSPKTIVPAPEDHIPLDQYRGVVEEMVSDRKLNKVEVDRLNAFARQLDLSREQTADIERRVLGNSKEAALLQQYQRAVEMIWADQKLNGMEAEWLNALADELGLSRDQISHTESRIMGAAKEAILERQNPEPSTRPENFILAHTLTGHSDEVHSVAFSPDGQFLASGASDYTIRGWNVRTGQPVGTLSGHVGRVSSVTFDPKGELLASGGFDKTVRVWKLPNGEPFHTLNHSDWVFSVVFSPDGKVIASGGADKEIKLWNLEAGKLLRALTGHSHWVLSVAFSPDGRSLISGGADKSIKVWSLETDETLYTFEHPDWVRSVAVDPDGRHIASGCEDGAIRIWDLETGSSVRTIAGHSGPVLSVAIDSDGQLLYSSGSDGKIKIWEPRTGEPLDVLTAHPDGVGYIIPSPDGRLLASGGYDHAIRVWRKEGTEGLAISGLKDAQATGRPPYARQGNLPPYKPGMGQPGRPQDLPD